MMLFVIVSGLTGNLPSGIGGSRACPFAEVAQRSDGAGTGTQGNGYDGHCRGRCTREPRGCGGG